jgi:hypothetical protein
VIEGAEGHRAVDDGAVSIGIDEARPGEGGSCHSPGALARTPNPPIVPRRWAGPARSPCV